MAIILTAREFIILYVSKLLYIFIPQYRELNCNFENKGKHYFIS